MENMTPPKRDIGLIVAIVFASVAVSGSLVFLGLQIGDNALAAGSADSSANVLDSQINDAIEKFAAKQEQEAKDQQVVNDEPEKIVPEKTNDMAKNVPPVGDSEPVYGSADAKVTLIEYSDLKCPFCKKFHETAKSVVDDSDGSVNWVYRHFPLGFHDPDATSRAMAVECAGELGGAEKFWEYLDAVYEENPVDNDALIASAGNLGIDSSAFKTCLESEKFKDKVASDMKGGANSGVTGTPGTIVYNNETGEAVLVKGAQPVASVQQAVDGVLEPE